MITKKDIGYLKKLKSYRHVILPTTQTNKKNTITHPVPLQFNDEERPKNEEE